MKAIFPCQWRQIHTATHLNAYWPMHGTLWTLSSHWINGKQVKVPKDNHVTSD